MLQINRDEVKHIRSKFKNAPLMISSKEKSKGKRKKYYIADSQLATPLQKQVYRELKEYRKTIVVLEKHGWFEEEYYDKNDKRLKTRTVYYK